MKSRVAKYLAPLLLSLPCICCSQVARPSAEVYAKAFAESSCKELHLSGYGSLPFWTNAIRACDADGPACTLPPPKGEIQVVSAKYGKIEGCNFWKASRLEAEEIVHDFDTFESHAPEVVYKSSGKYPVWVQKVVKGGCPPDGKNYNCAD